MKLGDAHSATLLFGAPMRMPVLNGDDGSDTPGEAAYPPYYGRNMPDPDQYGAYTTEFDEIIEAEELCGADELQRLRPACERYHCDRR